VAEEEDPMVVVDEALPVVANHAGVATTALERACQARKACAKLIWTPIC
jgi:hypothetical protein